MMMKFNKIGLKKFEDSIYEKIKKHEKFVPRIYTDHIGIPTLGVGYAIFVTSDGKKYEKKDTLTNDLKEIGVTLTDKDKKLLDKVLNYLNNGQVAKAQGLIPEYKIGEKSDVKNKFSFEIKDNQGFTLFQTSLNRALRSVKTRFVTNLQNPNTLNFSKKKAIAEADQLYNALENTREMVTLASLAFNLPKLIGPNLTAALYKGDRPEAWYEIRYNSNAKHEYGQQNRRDKESDNFGLYDDPNNVQKDEADNVNRFIESKRQDIYKYLGKIKSTDEDKTIRYGSEELQKEHLERSLKEPSQGGQSITGNEGNEDDNLLDGTQGNDTLEGNGGNDTLKGNGGNDLIDGGEGKDTAVFSDKFANYEFSKATENGVEVVNIKHTKGTKSDGDDKLINVENLKFSDRQLSLSSIIETISPEEDVDDGKPGQEEKPDNSYEGDGLLDSITNGISDFFGELNKSVNELIYKNTPVVGDEFNSGIQRRSSSIDASQFLAKIEQEIIKKIESEFDSAREQSATEIKKVLTEALGKKGLDILKSDIQVVETPKDVKFKIQLGGDNSFKTDIDSSLGVPGLGLDVDGKAEVGLDYEFDLNFGVNYTNGFYFDTSSKDELEIGLNAKIPDFNADAELGFLNFQVQDDAKNPSKIGTSFTIDLQDSGGKLFAKEISSVKSEKLIDADITGGVDINLKLESNLNKSAVLPSINSDLNIDWSLDKPNEVPNVEFNNVSLNMGSLFDSFVTPVLGEVQKVTKPIQPFIDLLQRPIPGFSSSFFEPVKRFYDENKDGKITLIDFAKKLDPKNEYDEVIEAAEELGKLIDLVNSIPTNTNKLEIDLGRLNLSKVDLSKPNVNLAKLPFDSITHVTEPIPANQQLKGTNASSFVSKLKTTKGAGLELPILTDPSVAFKLLLGQEAELFTYQMPKLNFSLGFDKFFPLYFPKFGPLGIDFGGSLGATLNPLGFGYDTYGLQKYLKSDRVSDIFQGFYVSDRAKANGTGADVPEANLNASISLGGSADAILVKGGVKGRISGQVDFNLFDPNNDGKVRLNELQLESLFDVSGELKAGVYAWYKYLDEKEEYGLGEQVLWTFEEAAAPDIKLGQKLSGGRLQLNIGTKAAARQEVNTTDGNEIFLVDSISGKAGNETLSIAGFNIVKNYSGIGKIVADADKGDDQIEITDDVLAPADIKGGSGKDRIYGGAGADTISGGTDDDNLSGGPGNDRVSGDAGADVLFGNDGEDSVRGNDGNDLIYGGKGSDRLLGDAGNDEIIGGEGKDKLFGGEGNDKMSGGEDDDELLGEAGNDTLQGEKGKDKLSGGIGNDIVSGGEGDDELSGDAGNDILGGGVGNDNLQGGANDDQLVGEEGEDTLDGGDGKDDLFGGDGNDILSGGTGDDWISGNAGNDDISGDEGQDKLYAGAGNDTAKGGTGDDEIYATTGNNKLSGGAGNDSVEIKSPGKGNNELYGEAGNDTLIGGLGEDKLFGGEGGDLLAGGAGEDELFGGEGDDALSGNGGNDSISGDAGKDTIFGNDGDDELDGGKDDDIIEGDSGKDYIKGGFGNDKLLGGEGDDYLSGQGGNDLLGGETGDDTLSGDAGDDTVSGGAGNDKITDPTGENYLLAGDGNDTVVGGKDKDKITGGKGDDQLEGGAGDDVILADAGDDVISGGTGTNKLTGGAGSDLFLLNVDQGIGKISSFEERSLLTEGLHFDVIDDFKPGEDFLDLQGQAKFDDLIIERIAGNARISSSETGDIIALLVGVEDIREEDFLGDFGPKSLQFSTTKFNYDLGETVKLKNASVSDQNGVADLDRVDFWLKKNIEDILEDSGSFEDIEDVISFTADANNKLIGNFNFELTDLEAGYYTLQGRAYDKSGAASKNFETEFLVGNANIPPQDLQWELDQSSYGSDEVIKLTNGRVYDSNGVDDLTEISFEIKGYDREKEESYSQELTQKVTEFQEDKNDGRWGEFSYEIDLSNLNINPGSYTLYGYAQDDSVNVDLFTSDFVVGDPTPKWLRFYTHKENYQPSEVLQLTGDAFSFGEVTSKPDVYDIGGAKDLEKVDFWLKKEGGEWQDIKDATNFTPDPEFDKNTPFVEFDYQFNLNGLEEGNYTLKGTAYDKSGNQSETVEVSFLLAENFPPMEPFFDNKTTKYSVGETVEIDIGVLDPDGDEDLDRVRFELQKDDGKSEEIELIRTKRPAGVSFNYDLKGLDEGSYKLKATVYDRAGAASPSREFSFVVLNSTPELELVEEQKEGENVVDVLKGVRSPIVSPDGKNVYVSGKFDSAIGAFNRDPETGALTFLQKQEQSDGVDGLGGANLVLASPDGKNVYATGYSDEAIAVFSQDPDTGKLTFIEVHKQGENGVDGLVAPKSLAISPDGKSIYFVGSNSIAAFNRDPNTGRLTFLETHLGNYQSITVSPDGKGIYVVGELNSSIALFNRDLSTGKLTFQEVQQDSNHPFPNSVTVSPDGKNIYASTPYNFAGNGAVDRIAVFNRNPDTGVVTFQEVKNNGNDEPYNPRFDVFHEIVVSPDGKNVYAAGDYGFDVAVFTRNSETGALNFEEIHNNDNAGAVESITISPDGKSVYADSSSGDAIVVYNRNPETGELTFVESQKYQEEGNTLYVQGQRSMAVSANSKYVTVTEKDSIAVFSRDDKTGALSLVERKEEGDDAVAGLEWVESIAISEDGKHIYAAGQEEDALAVFSRNANGVLTFVEVHKDGKNGVDGLDYPQAVTLSPDGKSVYAAGASDYAIAVFNRDPKTGKLTFVEKQEEGENGVQGLKWPNSVTVSPDGKHIYATAENSNALTVFSRDTQTGALTFVETKEDNKEGVDGLDEANSVIVSPDGKHVYATGERDAALAVFSRDSSTGKLTFVEVEKWDFTNENGLRLVTSVTMSSDGHYVYATGSFDNTLVVFTRDSETGKLTFVKTESTSGESLTVSPDGNNIYSAGGDKLEVFKQPKAPEPIPNTAPTDLQLTTTKEAYQFGETIELQNAQVYDEEGTEDLSIVNFQVKIDGGEWQDVGDATEFTATQDDNIASFNHQITDLAPGNYELKAIAYDKSAATSDSTIVEFTIEPPSQAPELTLKTTKKNYEFGEPVRFQDVTVDDKDGIQDLDKVEFYLQQEGGEEIKVGEVTEFISSSGSGATFNHEIEGLAAGAYQLKAIALDKGGKESEAVTGEFTVTDADFDPSELEIIESSEENPPIVGDDEKNTLPGTFNDDLIQGLPGDDLLTGDLGNDTLEGGDGNDTLDGGSGEDLLNGGDGEDVADYQEAIASVTVNLKTESATDESGNKDTLKNIENVIGSRFDDNLQGNPGKNQLTGGDGNDTLTGNGGADILQGGTGDDVYQLEIKNAKGTQIEDNGGTDTLELTGVTLTLNSLAKGKIGFQQNGTDLIIDINKDGKATKSKDITIKDFASKSGESPGEGFIEAIGNLSGEEILATINNNSVTKTGNKRNNRLNGTKKDDYLDGKAGNDIIIGRGGNDTLVGGDGNDKLQGNAGNDVLDGGIGKDKLIGGSGNDTLKGGGGLDILNGGGGNDTYELDSKTAAGSKIIDSAGNDTLDLTEINLFISDLGRVGKNLVIDINYDGKFTGKQDLTIKNFFTQSGKEKGKGFIETVDGLNGTDILSNLSQESGPLIKTGNDKNNRLRGSKGEDIIDGLGGNDVLTGNDGNDTLTGGNGNDKLNGGKGEDVLTGSAGKDSFIFTHINQTETDEITDFVSGEDKIVLDKSAFTALKSRKGRGFSVKSEFAVVDDEADVASSTGFIVYNQNTGELFYNANGNKPGLGSGGLFAKLDLAPDIGATDFRIQP
ncbi:MAG: beta-propeller fold lactonase family protein [Okeania sp. SIO3I5]|uniref:beta-propeller fold lactonase family protein n=1 Tax=Okeania sp. SIO3I5 TaxID=2607805 RepID=UPI0013B9880F|nr:beta-propeller fold lactonase family protein [Okeania sp. SIO3I5]NEQ38756.1 beta-propeller fold lactonase family protein [Okeania sp. SIO3I5]